MATALLISGVCKGFHQDSRQKRFSGHITTVIVSDGLVFAKKNGSENGPIFTIEDVKHISIDRDLLGTELEIHARSGSQRAIISYSSVDSMSSTKTTKTPDTIKSFAEDINILSPHSKIRARKSYKLMNEMFTNPPVWLNKDSVAEYLVWDYRDKDSKHAFHSTTAAGYVGESLKLLLIDRGYLKKRKG
jgi:hypothetical protein